jgi:hypothetical protein
MIPSGESRGGTPSSVRAPKGRAPHRKMRRLVTLRLPAFRFLHFLRSPGERSETRGAAMKPRSRSRMSLRSSGLRNQERKTERQAPPLPFLGPNRFRASRDRILPARAPFSIARGKPRAPRRAARMRALAPSAPAKRGRGTTGAREASEPWRRGRLTRSFVSGAENSRRKKKRAREHVRRSPKFPRRVESCAPSTTLLRRVVPLPRYRGGG